MEATPSPLLLCSPLASPSILSKPMPLLQKKSPNNLRWPLDRKFAKTLSRPFEVRYDPYTQTVHVLDRVTSVSQAATDIQEQLAVLANAMRKMARWRYPGAGDVTGVSLAADVSYGAARRAGERHTSWARWATHVMCARTTPPLGGAIPAWRHDRPSNKWYCSVKTARVDAKTRRCTQHHRCI